MTKKEQDKYKTNIATLSQLGTNLYEGFKDLADGTPQKEMAIQMAHLGTGFIIHAEKMKKLTSQDVNDRLKLSAQ